MPTNVDIFIDRSERGSYLTRFYAREGSLVSPNGRFCCYFVFLDQSSDDTQEDVMLKRIHFVDLITGSQNKFDFQYDAMLTINSSYWLTDNLLVFLRSNGLLFQQTMYRINIQETKCMEKESERVYMLPNEIAKQCWLRSAPNISFHGDDYIVWVDSRTENAGCSALFLIPQNPNDQHLTLRKFAMNLCTKNNSIFRTNAIMMAKEISQEGRVLGAPFVRQNQLLFRICMKRWDEYERFSPIEFLFGVFLSVNVEKLQEVKGLEYDEKEIKENTGAYSMYDWTDFTERINLQRTKVFIQQSGKYLILENFLSYSNVRTALVVNLEDHSFTFVKAKSKYDQIHLILHPSGLVTRLLEVKEYGDTHTRYRLMKVKNRWRNAKLEDIVRRNIILNEDIDKCSVEEYKHLIYKR